MDFFENDNKLFCEQTPLRSSVAELHTNILDLYTYLLEIDKDLKKIGIKLEKLNRVIEEEIDCMVEKSAYRNSMIEVW